MRQSTHDDLQHPRRNLGNRYRSQAQKFVRLAKNDPGRKDSNMQWAEQNARPLEVAEIRKSWLEVAAREAGISYPSFSAYQQKEYS